ncbi:MAG: methyl-accepting chemotaxis protein, partial [Treponema sp.]|nr:methyl-accepting chemotaxis protein [Treponema sp.]
MTDQKHQIRRTSIKRRVIVFSAIMLAVILIGGSAAYTLSMLNTVHANAGSELVKAVEIERIKLEASVNSEVAVAMKMANSPLIKRHFLDPADENLRRIAFEEIIGYQQTFASKMTFWAGDVDKEFYFDIDNHYTVDTNDPGNYWYNMTLYETEKFNFNINYNPEMQRIMLWINAPVFDSNRKPLGLVGTGIDLTEFVDTLYRDYKGDAALYFFNASGEITGARDMALITNKVTLDKELDAIGTEILAGVNELKSGEIKYINTPGGVVVALGEVPAVGWYITAVLPVTLLDALKNSTTFLFLVMMAVITLIFVIFLAFIFRLLKPLDNMVKALDQISTDWDLTRRLQFQRHDEIGTLCNFFNLTFERIKNLILNIKNEAAALSDIGGDLASNMNITANAVNQITGNVQ